MKRHLVALIAFTAACTDPVVEMELVMPKTADSGTTAMNTSCITGFEVHANGATYPSVQTDTVRSCIEITAGATYQSVRDAIKGKFQLGIPDTGLSSVDIYGWSGAAPCMDDMDAYVSPDLLFFGSADYIGQDKLELPIVPNVDCALSPVNVRMYDMFALVGGATCTAAVAPGANSAGIGTLVPRAHDTGTEWYGDYEGADMVNGVSSFQGPTHVGTKSCLAIDAGGSTGGSTGCVVGGTSVCAPQGDIEQAYVPGAILYNPANFDTTLIATYPGVIIGSVWSNGTTKTPVSGATVTIDATHGKVVYIDPPATGGTALTVRSAQSTGSSGMFMLYTDTLVNAKVTANGATRTVTLGAADSTVAGAMIVMP